MSNQNATLNQNKSENITDEPPAAGKTETSHALPQPGSAGTGMKSRFANIRDYLRRNKTGRRSPNLEAQTDLPAGFIADFNNTRKDDGRHPYPEVDLELSYPLINCEELDPKTIEAYKRRVHEMLGRLNTGGQFGGTAFTRGLAEEIVGMDVCMRMCFDKIYREVFEEVKCALDEALGYRQDNLLRTLESRPSYLSQRINEQGNGDMGDAATIDGEQ